MIPPSPTEDFTWLSGKAPCVHLATKNKLGFFSPGSWPQLSKWVGTHLGSLVTSLFHRLEAAAQA